MALASPIPGALRGLSRALGRQPSFVLATVGAIALGVGAATSVFTLVDAVLLRPLPIADPATLINVHRTRPEGSSFGGFSRDSWQTLRSAVAGRVDLEAFTGLGASLRLPGASAATELVSCQVVSSGYLDMLGVRPVLGRGFVEGDDAPGSREVALIGEAYWQRRFGGAPDVVGRTIVLGGRPFTVAGVLPRGFRGHFVGFSFDVWVPLGAAEAVLGSAGVRGDETFELIGRRSAGVSLAAARGALDAAMGSWVAAHPAQHGDGVDVRLATPLDDDLRGAVQFFLAALLGIAVLVLAIAAVNVAGMLLARAESRRREIVVRRALGAGTGDLAQLLLAESLTLSAVGGALGVALAAVASRLFTLLAPASLPLVLDLRPDVRVLAFAVAATAVTGLLAGLAPALQARGVDLNTGLREAAASLAGGTRLRRVFVAGQIALALVLIVLAGLFGRAVAGVTAGVPSGSLTTAEILWPVVRKDDATGRRFYAAFAERAAALPGVSAVSFARRLPFGPERPGAPVARVEDAPPEVGRVPGVDTNVVAPGFFGVLDRPLLGGREFSSADTAEAPPVAIVSASLAARLWPEASPLGRELWIGATPPAAPRRVAVVGIARDVVFGGAVRRATLYLPAAQSPLGRMVVLVRGSEAAAAVAGPLVAIARELEPDLPAPLAGSLESALGLVLLPQRVAAATALALGALGLGLALAGVYAVVAYSVARRRRELAIRVAIGARPRDLIRLVAGEQGRLALGAGAAGLVLAVGAATLLRGFLLGVGAADPLTLIAAGSLVSAVVVLASLPGARQAATVDPAHLLRSE